MKLSTDLRTLELSINGRYTATELDVLLRALAELRATMLPGVPQSRADLLQDGSAGSVLIEKEPSITIAARRNGGFRMWVRNQGFGWLAYEIDNRAAIGVRDMIAKHTGGVEDVNLFGKGDGHTH